MIGQVSLGEDFEELQYRLSVRLKTYNERSFAQYFRERTVKSYAKSKTSDLRCWDSTAIITDIEPSSSIKAILILSMACFVVIFSFPKCYCIRRHGQLKNFALSK